MFQEIDALGDFHSPRCLSPEGRRKDRLRFLALAALPRSCGEAEANIVAPAMASNRQAAALKIFHFTGI